jgi:hypothetical protein
MVDSNTLTHPVEVNAKLWAFEMSGPNVSLLTTRKMVIFITANRTINAKTVGGSLSGALSNM